MVSGQHMMGRRPVLRSPRSVQIRSLRWLFLAVGMVSGLSTCHQVLVSRAEQVRLEVPAVEAARPLQRQSPPTTWPGLAEAAPGSVDLSSSGGAVQTPPKPTIAKQAIIRAEEPDAAVTVRSQPSTDAIPLGYGTVGDTVVLEREETNEAGELWHYVVFQQGLKGWVRSDLLAIQAPSPGGNETKVDGESTQAVPAVSETQALRSALDEACADGKAIEASFITPNHSIYVCQVRGNHLYFSQEKGTTQVIRVSDVEAIGEGYFVTNGDYEYRIDPRSFVIVRIDGDQQKEVLRETVLYTEHY